MRKPVQIVSCNEKKVNCPTCGKLCGRHSTHCRKIKSFGGFISMTVSKHSCVRCQRIFTNPASLQYAPTHTTWSWEFILEALRCVENRTLFDACFELRKQSVHNISPSTLHEWVHRKEELLAQFAGYN